MKKNYLKPEIVTQDIMPENNLCTLSEVELLSTPDPFLPDEDGVSYF